MLEGNQDHVRAGDLGLMLLLVQGPVERLRDLINFLRIFRVTMELDIPSAARILHADRTEYDKERGAGDPFLSMGDLCDLFDQAAVRDHVECPGLLIPARRGKARGFKHLLDYVFRDGSALEPADADAAFQ